MPNSVSRSKTFFVLVLSSCVLLVGGVYIQPVEAVTGINEGGPILSLIEPLPCVNLTQPSFPVLKLSYNAVPVIIPIAYPYIPGVIAKHQFLPGVPIVTTLGKAVPGACVILVPCPTGVCPWIIPVFISTLYGSHP